MPPLPLSALNHVSVVVSSIGDSVDFFVRVLGFQRVQRPRSFEFEGAWLWRGGMALHLIQGTPLLRNTELNPESDHLSFVTDASLEECAARLSSLDVPYVQQRVEEGGLQVDQLFFHTPDRLTIEICNCDSLPVLPLERGGGAERCPSCALDAAPPSAACSEASEASRMSVELTRP